MSVEKTPVTDYFQRGMLDDREYMRQSSGRLRLSATVFLLAANILIYILQHYVTPRLLNDN